MVRTLSATRTAQGEVSVSSSRFFQVVLLVFGITILWHHMLLTARHGSTTNSSSSSGGSVGVTLETLYDQIGASRQLSTQQKEELIGTIHQLQAIRQHQQEQAAAALQVEHLPKGQYYRSPYAYMFVMAGVDDRHPNAYRGFLYDVFVATHLFRELGSTADVVLFYEMAPEATTDKLPDMELGYLKALNIVVKQLPKPTKASFASVVFEKFRALELTDYRRVVFMDADAIPLANLDYMFHLSDPQHTSTPTILQPNLIMASRGEPCNAGVFMLQPKVGSWQQLQGIIQRQQDEGQKLEYPHFSWWRGWGYNWAQEGEFWRGNAQNGKNWRFHAGHSDQGLLYYWTKYHQQRVSIVIQDQIENWIPAPDPTKANKTIHDGLLKPVLQNTLTMEPLLQYSNPEGPLVAQFSCDLPQVKQKLKQKQPHQCIVPYRDFAHFMGDNKPWMAFSPLRRMRQLNSYQYNAASALWFRTLQKVDQQLNLQLDYENWYEKHFAKSNPYGKMAMFSDIKDAHDKHDKKKE